MDVKLLLEDDPFIFLGILPTFDLDLEILEKRYLELSKLYHPDKNLKETRLATLYTAKLNTSYKTLLDPYSRAHCLLDSFFWLDSAPISNDFLEKILNYTELLNADTSRDQALSEIQAQIQTSWEQIKRAFQIYFQTKDSKELNIIARELVLLKYWNRLLS